MSPANAQRLLQEGLAHHRAGRLAEAERFYTQARPALPREFDAFYLSGLLAMQQGRIADSVNFLARALQLNPRAAQCAAQLGQSLMMAGRRAEAEQYLRHAVKLLPDYAEGWDVLAYCLKAQDKLAEAVACHERVVALQPKFAQGWYHYGLTLSLTGRSGDALNCHGKALGADPKYANGHYGRAQALYQLNRITEAVEAYDEYLRREPGNLEAHSYRLFALNYLHDLPREKLFEEHAAYGARVGQRKPVEFPNTPDAGRRIRVGIVSPDLRVHSCAYFLEPLLRHIDRERFEVFLYHDHFREDAMSTRLKGLAAAWRNLVGLSMDVAEKIIRADRPDILIDLAGHTGMACRLQIFARNLAPVQINYLGYPNTTGLPAIGYRFTDAVADPEGEADAFAVEKLVRFAPTAWCYQPPVESPEPAIEPRRADEPITFGCFNNPGKIGPATIRLWGKLLGAVPESRLFLKGNELGNADIRRRFLGELAAVGIAEDRVEFLERTRGVAEHLALYGRMNVALDTFPYNGTTTTCEALWMGVPVVTLCGDRHVSRVSSSLLTAIGRPGWVARSEEDYVRIASELAADRAGLAKLRADLRDELLRSPLMDHAGQANRFGDALHACWTNWCTAKASVEAAVC